MIELEKNEQFALRLPTKSGTAQFILMKPSVNFNHAIYKAIRHGADLYVINSKTKHLSLLWANNEALEP